MQFPSLPFPDERPLNLTITYCPEQQPEPLKIEPSEKKDIPFSISQSIFTTPPIPAFKIIDSDDFSTPLFPPRTVKHKDISIQALENSNSTENKITELSEKELRKLKRQKKNREYAQQSRDRKKEQFTKLTQHRDKILQLGQETELILQDYFQAFPDSFLKPYSTLAKSTQAISELGSIDEAVETYQKRIYQIIKIIISEAIVNQEATQFELSQLNKQIQQLKEENTNLRLTKESSDLFLI